MYPPLHILKKIQEMHSNARLGWTGEGENGRFYLLQLIKRQFEEYEFNEPWDNRGPVYGNNWDRNSRIPYIMAGPFHPSEVDDDAFPEAFKRMLTSVKQRLIDSAIERGKSYEDAVSNLAGEIGEYLYWLSQKTDAVSDRTKPQNDLTEHEKAVLSGEAKKDLTQAFMPQW